MWLLNVLLVAFIFLLMLIIISTSMKIGLMITNKHNYDSKLLIIPSILIMLLWGISLLVFYLCNKSVFANGLEDMILTIIMMPSSIEHKRRIIITSIIIIILTVLIQSFTYYAINVDYNKLWGYIRFGIKKKLNIKPKKNAKTKKMVINEERFDVPLNIAIITSTLTFVISTLLILGLYKIGTGISKKIIS